MTQDLLHLTLGFLEGIALILSPCILPILPLILAGSLSGGKTRPFGIISGFVIIFSLFTLFSRQLVASTNLDLNLLRYLSYGLLFSLGLIMLSTTLTERFTRLTQGLAKTGQNVKWLNDPSSGYWSGFLFGGLIALVWTPCAGPILAAVIVQTVLEQSNVVSFLTLLAFSLGAAIPMMLIALFGRQIINKASGLKKHSSAIRKGLGLIIIAAVVYMVYGENNVAGILTPPSIASTTTEGMEKGLEHPYPAPALTGLENWLNGSPLTLQSLHGKVVLIDFWTYSCINCVRTLPYLKDWYQKYHDKGLEIIGVHTPEFEFEKVPANVKAAVLKYGILYPVAQDNHFATWQAFSNRYWPAHYLINKEGKVVYVHFGEGDDEITENNIRYLLGLEKTQSIQPMPQASANSSQTPETYLGSRRAQGFANRQVLTGKQPFSFPYFLELNTWALQGQWQVGPEAIISRSVDAAIKIHFNARKVFVVMGSLSGKAISVDVKLNDQTPTSGQGKNLSEGKIVVKLNTLYEVLDLDQFSEGTLELHPLSPGLMVYTFTFGP